MQWNRTLSIVKEVSKGQVKLTIPFISIPVKQLTVESWSIHVTDNTLQILLHREEPPLIRQELKEKRGNWDHRMYPGELQ